jgi:hypothetical protein
MPKKMINFGSSFTEKLRQKREARHAEEITKLTKADEAKRVMELARLDKIVEDSSEKKPQFLRSLSWLVNLRSGHCVFHHRFKPVVLS